MTWTRLRADAAACYRTALDAVDPARLVAAHLLGGPEALVLRGRDGRVLARHAGPVVVVGAGKAALGMARAASAAADRRVVGGVVIVPHGAGGEAPGAVRVLAGGHPLPDVAGEAATARLLDAARGAGGDVLVLALLSGGASSLLVAPAPGLTLADKRAVTAALLAAGADIGALNAVRKHCSLVKGGGLARAAAGSAGLWALVLSDVVGDDPAVVASGPTVPDPTTYQDALGVLDRHLAPRDVPYAVREHLERGCAGERPETVKPGDAALGRARTLVVGGNRLAVEAAAGEAARRGYGTVILDEPLAGEAAPAGRSVAARLLALPPGPARGLVAGGETTVRVVPGGRGGRSQHLALAAAVALADTAAVVLAAGTDGIDGPTDAAGGCVDGGTVGRARAAGFDPAGALEATDSFPLLAATGDLLRTGPTGTNVADLVVALRPAT